MITEYCSNVANNTTMSIERTANGSGTSAAITATFANTVTNLTSPVSVLVKAPAGNGTNLTPTFQADGTAAATIVRQGNVALSKNDIPFAGYWMELEYDTTYGKWVLLNPANLVPAKIGSMKDYVTISENTTLTEEHFGKYIYVNAACTITLPNPSSFEAGNKFFIQAAGAVDAGVTIVNASGTNFGGSNAMGMPPGGVNTFVIPAGHSSGFYTTGGSGYAMQDGTLYAVNARGNMRGYGSITASRSLTVDDIGMLLWANISGGTFTLPTPISLGLKAGATFEIAASSNPITLAPGAGATLGTIGVASSNLALSSGVVYNVTATSDTGWFARSYQSGTLLDVKRFTSSGTYTPTPGTRKIKVSVQAAGGGSGGVAATAAGQTAASGGGAAGSFISAWINGVSASVAVTVGAGGAGGAAGANPGGQGGSSLFGSYLAAGGGYGGAGAEATTTNAVRTGGAHTTMPTYNGVSIVDEWLGGMPGGPGYYTVTNGLSPGIGGSSRYGSSTLYLGGSGSGHTGQGYGSGASGAVNYSSQVARAGAAGAQGIVIVEEYA